MKRLALLLTSLAAFVLPGVAQAESWPCGLPESRPLWVDFSDASVAFRKELFGKPGLVLATNGTTGAAELRALGAQTVYWHMKLYKLVGTPKAPADHATIPAAAEDLLQKAVASTGCQTPVIALNELFGSYTPSPWAFEVAMYRANVLSLVESLAARGAVPFLLVPGPWYGRRAPFLAGDARVWWQEVAQYAHIVREMNFNAPYIYAKGPIVGSRTRRIAMRKAISRFEEIGISADRMGLSLGFQSTKGKGGREGLQPREAWLEIVKQDALAAKEVASELAVGSVWSWGWGTFGPETADPDKPVAACVYLWARDPAFCDGPAVAGPRFDTSLVAAQIGLPPGVQCRTGLGDIDVASVDELATALGSRQLALNALLSRLLYKQASSRATNEDIVRAEQAIVTREFGGDKGAYQAALAEGKLSRDAARRIIADQFHRQAFEAVVQIRYAISSPETFTVRRQKEVLGTAICLRDELPGVGIFDWSGYVPFLRLRAPSVSIRAPRHVVPRGRPITLSGRVASERASEAVTVYARGPNASAFTAVGSVRVGADGTWRLQVAPRSQTYYRALSKSAASPAISVRVKTKT